MKVSIITINRNNATELKRTLFSVASQTYSEFEHIIVDGGSTDGSVDVIKDYEKKSCPIREGNRKGLLWISEPDHGIYNAMNKGVRMAMGDYLLFLNAGDTFASSDSVAELMALDLDADIIIGRVNVVKGDTILSADHTVKGDITLFNLYMWGIPHQGTLIKRELLLQTPYDEHLRIDADFKFFLQKIILDNCSVQYIPLTISNYDNSGISSTNHELEQTERKQIFAELIPERIRKDYMPIFPHYYEVYRVEWLLRHKFFYRVYRAWTTLGRLLTNKQKG